ncbi:hypothetical protein B0H66DRAFT_130772 [Apodospora peruviana]|uniref:Gylcosyl hydrolase 115 C-terminal domain-containing protein n=1 Tax=Apodospora peruviana TaxID=516989 RepID=A0AAE0IIL2_9PEZI|nr:hypothetical protein B0H66DRAFT_130772 [Apodospora peruviana]
MAFVRLLSLAIGTLYFSGSGAAYKKKPSAFTFSAEGTGYQLGGPHIAPEIRVAPDDLPGVIRVANDLAADFGKVLGVNGTVVTADWKTSSQKTSSRPIIVIGTIGQSSLVDNLVTSAKLDVAAVAKKWETYSQQVLQAPWAGQDSVFVIAGSDLRGTVFGAYEVSEQIGVSPWHYWADVPPTKRQYIWASSTVRTEGPPSVKYRGIFLNDEAPALTGWGHANFKDSQYGSAFVSDFYKRIFDLVLRLKGNYVWPAMWSSMFYLDDPKNGPMATEYGIFMGTSHHEPMARADKEQSRFLKGSWDWKGNRAGVQSFMQEGATRSKNWSTIYTLGMRGSGDAASATLTSSALEEVIKWQQATLTKTLGKPLSEIPQAWVMYKEVPGYWQKGMDVSDDVTLLWSDDNRGNIRRIPIGKEINRSGGTGMYYHFDYVGDPRNYKWINTIQLQKTWEQMSLAYDRGVDKIWIANVGDLKALELPTAHFMALAWDRASFDDPGSTTEWLKDWSARQFGDDAADSTASIMTIYGKLLSRMKYEDLSRTPFAFSAVNYDEAELNYKEWTDLVASAQAVYEKLPSATQISFFEVVLHPVLAGKTVYEIYTKTALGGKLANEHRVSANQFARDVQTAFQTDKDIAKRFHTLLNGKWNHFMDQTHIGYNNWQEPSSNSIPKQTTVTSSVKNALMGVSVQYGTSFFPTTAKLTLPALSRFTAPSEQRWLDVYARDNGTFSYTITSDTPYVKITNAKSTITAPGAGSDIRSIVTVDWTAAPAGSSSATLTVAGSASATATVILPIENPTVPADFKGHIEASGAVSLEAEHFVAGGNEYVVVPDYGRTLSGVKLPTKSVSYAPGKGPALTYSFYTFTATSSASLTFYLSPSENANPTSPNRYTFAVDGGAQTTVQPVPLNDGSSQPAGWSDAVVKGSYVKSASLGKLAAGKHELKVWLLEPTMVLTKLVVDVGGVKTSLMGPPESMIIS